VLAAFNPSFQRTELTDGTQTGDRKRSEATVQIMSCRHITLAAVADQGPSLSPPQNYGPACQSTEEHKSTSTSQFRNHAAL
jgi:hypothetical protein